MSEACKHLIEQQGFSTLSRDLQRVEEFSVVLVDVSDIGIH
jgi:hypothetical protein